MNYQIIEAACYLGASFFAGATVTGIWMRRRWHDLHRDFLFACNDIGRLSAERDTWKHEANIFARELQELRAKVPQRDPVTHRFVKRNDRASVWA